MSENAIVEMPENGAEMDYEAHHSTYGAFVALFKWGTAFCIALMIAMAIGFFAGGGLVAGTIALIILMAISGFLLK